jgi:hypothetical protein
MASINTVILTALGSSRSVSDSRSMIYLEELVRVITGQNLTSVGGGFVLHDKVSPQFLALAWTAANAKAKEIGWIA